MSNEKLVKFSDDIAVIPADILASHAKDDVTWEHIAAKLAIKRKKLKKATAVIQTFVRSNVNILHHFNQEKCRLMEELDNVEMIKKSEMERIADFLEEMKRGAALEMAEEQMDINVDEDLKNEVKDLEVENAQLKRDLADLKGANKQLAVDTFALYEQFASSVKDVRGMESERKRMCNVRDQFSQAVEMLRALEVSVHKDVKREKKERKRLEKCIDAVIAAIEERYQKNKLADKLWDMKDSIIQAEFLANMPIQES